MKAPVLGAASVFVKELDVAVDCGGNDLLFDWVDGVAVELEGYSATGNTQSTNTATTIAAMKKKGACSVRPSSPHTSARNPPPIRIPTLGF